MFQLYDSPMGISEAQEHRDKVERGELDRFESLKAAMTFYMRALDKGKKLARRARIRRQWEAKGQDGVFDEYFKRQERAVLATLKEVAVANNFLEFSDDEVEEAAESVSRRKETTAEEENEEDDENAWYESDGYHDVEDDDQSTEGGQGVEEGSDEQAENEGGVGFAHLREI